MNLAHHADSGLLGTSIVLRLLVMAMILLLTTSAQAQRQTAATHIVRPGETLGRIAQVYSVNIQTLAAANGISNAHLIHTWQELAIPSDASPPATAAASGRTHVVRRGESLGRIAKSYGIAVIDLMALNNVYGWVYPGDELALPASANAPAPAVSSPTATSSGTTHIVRNGETLGSIAAAYGLSVYDLQAANNIWTWIIYAGQELEIPGDGALVPEPESPAEPSTSGQSPAPEKTNAPVESSGIAHTVQFGETLGAIAKAYAVSLDDLQALNNISSWVIYVGQELEIPAGGTPPETPNAQPEVQTPATPVQNAAPANQPDTHTVQRGETLFSIAKIYGVDLNALIRANGIADVTKIHSGLVLRVRDLDSFVPPQPSTGTTANSPAPRANVARETYTVQSGEFLSQIGARFGMSWLAIAKVNGLSNPDALKVGMVLQIPTAEEAAKYGPVQPIFNDPGARVGVGREFVVVLGTQMAYAYEDGVLKRSARISSGLPDTPTVKGDFRIRSKVRSQRMRGEDYDLDNVEWVMYFYAGYAFHGTWWHYNFGTPMSRGCVNMTNADAKWFYEFGSIGTPVHVRD
jgi:LysM repeat protein